MGLNFRLEERTGVDYIDLFPKTEISSVVGADKSYRISTMKVTIPAFTGFQQKINITANARQKISPFYVILESKEDKAQKSYDTIDQIEINGNQLIVTRFDEGADTQIEVTLVFEEVGI